MIASMLPMWGGRWQVVPVVVGGDRDRLLAGLSAGFSSFERTATAAGKRLFVFPGRMRRRISLDTAPAFAQQIDACTSVRRNCRLVAGGRAACATGTLDRMDVVQPIAVRDPIVSLAELWKSSQCIQR